MDSAEGVSRWESWGQLVEIEEIGEEASGDRELPTDRGGRQGTGFEVGPPGESVFFGDRRQNQTESTVQEGRKVAQVRGVHAARARRVVVVDETTDPIFIH
jgi:hypothetical protein